MDADEADGELLGGGPGDPFDELSVERRSADRRRADVPVPVDRRRTDDRRASRLAPERAFAGVAAIVDSWPLVRAGIRHLLTDRGFRVAVDAASADVAARAIGDRLDLAVLGVSAEDPIHAVARLRRLPTGGDRAAPCVVLLMERVDADELRALLEAGVDGVVQRSIGMDDLGAAVDRALAGQRVLSGGPLSVLASAGLQVAEPPAEAGPAILTRKELEVLSHLTTHQSNAEIARSMHVSAATVKTHLSNIYGKLEVRGRREAVVAAVERGLLT